MTNQSETAWETNSGQLMPPQTVQLISSGTIFSGEILELSCATCVLVKPYPDSVFTGFGATDLYEVFDLDFSAPGLQPPGWNVVIQQMVSAPWTLSFQQPIRNGADWRVPGAVTLNSVQASPTTIELTYVIQPMQPLLTIGGICPGNSAPFAPGPGVISNNPLSVTIPAGQTQVNLAPRFEGLGGGAAYNVQVIAWQPSITVDGQEIINPQSAYCITVPGS